MFYNDYISYCLIWDDLVGSRYYTWCEFFFLNTEQFSVVLYFRKKEKKIHECFRIKYFVFIFEIILMNYKFLFFLTFFIIASC
jgi:hypothetical protein